MSDERSKRKEQAWEGEARLTRSMPSRADAYVRFMREKMEKAGCAVHPEFFHVEMCDIKVGGGFRPEDGIVVCANHLHTQEDVDHAVTHELIHAYDHCRAKTLDWNNCLHHACSEIRAATLSGDCAFKQELLRGNFGINKQFQNCVKRRALLSVNMNQACTGERAEHAVEEAFQKCFKYSEPFDRIP